MSLLLGLREIDSRMAAMETDAARRQASELRGEIVLDQNFDARRVGADGYKGPGAIQKPGGKKVPAPKEAPSLPVAVPAGNKLMKNPRRWSYRPQPRRTYRSSQAAGGRR